MHPTDGHKTSLLPLTSEDLNRALRVNRMLYIVCLIIVVVEVPWALYNAVNQQWLMGFGRFVLIVVGIVAFILMRKDKTRDAIIVLTVTAFVVFFIGAAIFDIPTATTPRTIHIFFLMIGISSFISFKDEHYLLSYGFPLASFLAYGFFAISMWGINTPYALSANERVVSAWLYSILGLGPLYVLFHVMQTRAIAANSLEFDLRKALPHNQFTLYYQPQLGKSGQITGAEALIRWHHPVRGLIPPYEFIPLAEQIGLILPMGYWVLGVACAQLVRWSKKSETAKLSLSVNVSASEFNQDDYVAQVLSILKRSGAQPSLLKLELTESMLVIDVDAIITKMTELKAAGVLISLDDFGTGYSSLTYLKKLPLDQLKVDQSFIREMLTSSQDEAIVRTIVSLAQSMALEVIAEGVETEEQRQFLQSIGCFAIQGYLLSRPLRIHDFNVFLRNRMALNLGAVEEELQNS
jgi:EAL domain-containing protein (putative c-di-GMP-specific phosphodiesterase class I)